MLNHEQNAALFDICTFLRDIREDGRKIHAALESLGAITSFGVKRMSADGDRANAALDKIAADNAAMKDLLTQLVALAANSSDGSELKTLADKAEAVMATSDAEVAQAQAGIPPVATPPAAS